MICSVYVHPNAFETPVHTLRHKEERTAGELASALVGDVEEVDAPERGVHGGGEAGAGEALEARVEAEVLARCQRLPQQVMLRAHPLHSTERVWHCVPH